eukprot:XP_011615615.1 PREDICTED: uncharacterized protein LOC105418267 [Takifugu rubripes]
MQALPIWGLAIPLPAVLIITLSLYLVVLGIGFWLRSCLKERCSSWCDDCCPDMSPASEQCCRLVEMCDCKMPSMNSYWTTDCPINPVSPPKRNIFAPPDYDEPVCMEMGFILLYTERKHMWHIHFPQCANWDCACTCQPPECDSCNCLCFEIRVR